MRRGTGTGGGRCHLTFTSLPCLQETQHPGGSSFLEGWVLINTDSVKSILS